MNARAPTGKQTHKVDTITAFSYMKRNVLTGSLFLRAKPRTRGWPRASSHMVSTCSHMSSQKAAGVSEVRLMQKWQMYLRTIVAARASVAACDETDSRSEN